MIHRLADATYIEVFALHIQFDDGTDGDVNLESELLVKYSGFTKSASDQQARP